MRSSKADCKLDLPQPYCERYIQSSYLVGQGAWKAIGSEGESSSIQSIIGRNKPLKPAVFAMRLEVKMQRSAGIRTLGSANVKYQVWAGKLKRTWVSSRDGSSYQTS